MDPNITTYGGPPMNLRLSGTATMLIFLASSLAKAEVSTTILDPGQNADFMREIKLDEANCEYD